MKSVMKGNAILKWHCRGGFPLSPNFCVLVGIRLNAKEEDDRSSYHHVAKIKTWFSRLNLYLRLTEYLLDYEALITV